MLDREQLLAIWQRHSAKIVGALLGFLIGLFIKWIGLFWTIVITITTAVGYWIGARVDEDPETLPRLIQRLMPGGRQWRG